MAYDTALADRVRDQLAGEAGVTEQRMFGGLAFLLRGHLVVAASGRGGLLVRVPPEEVDRALARPHTEPMVLGGRPRPGWVRVAPEGIRTPAQLARWVGPATAHARGLPPKGTGDAPRGGDAGGAARRDRGGPPSPGRMGR